MRDGGPMGLPPSGRKCFTYCGPGRCDCGADEFVSVWTRPPPLDIRVTGEDPEQDPGKPQDPPRELVTIHRRVDEDGSVVALVSIRPEPPVHFPIPEEVLKGLKGHPLLRGRQEGKEDLQRHLRELVTLVLSGRFTAAEEKAAALIASGILKDPGP